MLCNNGVRCLALFNYLFILLYYLFINLFSQTPVSSPTAGASACASSGSDAWERCASGYLGLALVASVGLRACVQKLGEAR